MGEMRPARPARTRAGVFVGFGLVLAVFAQWCLISGVLTPLTHPDFVHGMSAGEYVLVQVITLWLAVSTGAVANLLIAAGARRLR